MKHLSDKTIDLTAPGLVPGLSMLAVQNVLALCFRVWVTFLGVAAYVLAEEEAAQVQVSLDWTGLQIMEEVYKRHQQYPYIYEEQSMVMVDRNGLRDTRKLRRYSRMEEDGTVRFMLIFDYPREVKGVALLANRDPSGKTEKSVYLPAFGEQLLQTSGADENGNFLGSDFSVENLTGEVLSDFQYVRTKDARMGDMRYFAVEVYDADDIVETAIPLRCHYIREDNFFITRTTHFDKRGRIYKEQSHHDLKPVDGDMWRSGMILMEDKKEQHMSLIKINRRIFSRDYVPEDMFSAQWLYENHPFQPGTELATEELDAETAEILDDLPDKVSALLNAQGVASK